VSSEDAVLFVSDDLLDSGRGRYWQNAESLQTVAGAGPENTIALRSVRVLITKNLNTVIQILRIIQ